MSIYTEQGYDDRDDYLRGLSEDMGIPFDMVWVAADMLGPNEDFDGLVTTLEDEADKLDHL